MVLAAGAWQRIETVTNGLPKTLLPVDGDRTILDVALGNLARAGMETAVVVTGHAAERIEERRGELEERHGVAVETVFNPKAVEWNNCYSLWCAREHFAHGVLLCNGDTVHPPEIEQRLLAARGHSDLVLALDDVKALGDEEMKVLLNADGLLRGINKAHDPAEAAGEYVGLTLIEPEASEGLAEALEATWRRDPSLYYEDGFQEYAERGGRVGVASVGGLEWVEVDDQRDLDRARELAWRC
jgi:choline kinase